MNDGQFVVPITTDDGQIIGWGRGPEMVESANFHKCIGTPLRHLRMVDGRVEQISQEEKDAMDAEDQAAQEAAQQDAQAQAEWDAAAAEQAAMDAENANTARVAQIQALRDAYVASTHTLCDIFGLARVDVLTMVEIQQLGAQLTDITLVLQAMQTAMAMSNIEQKLCRLDGPDALDRVSEVTQ